MAKMISLKLKEELLKEVDKIVYRKKISRNSYINEALENYNRENRRKFLQDQLERESRIVSKNSKKILKDLENLKDNLPE